MEFIIDYFSNIPSSHRSIILIGGLMLFFSIENILPFFNAKYDKWKHSWVNIFFTITTMLINFLMAVILLQSSDYAIDHRIGILQWIHLNSWFVMLIGVLLLDLIGAYAAHWIEHHVKWMWKFHLVHHTDQNIDTTTANRHHPGESVIRFIFTTLAVVIVGTPMWVVMLYQSLSAALSQFNHANINIPHWLDRALSPFLITPDIHRVHHHYRQPYTDCNYGNIFSIWDRIFKTLRVVENSKLKFGIDTHMEHDRSESIMSLLSLPFEKYRLPVQYPSEEQLEDHSTTKN